MTQPHLLIRDLHIHVDGTPIVQGFSLDIKGGEIHAIMGPNGTGKSTLAQALMGHPRYEVTQGTAMLDGADLLEMAVDERARAGLFLAMQDPSEIAGVSNANFIRLALNARQPGGKELPVLHFHRQLQKKMKDLGMDAAFAERYLNEGFSGGEKKRNEILQMAMLKPRIAILDEIDSGLDIDALKVVAQAVNDMRSPEMGVLIITHYQRLLEHIEPDHVHVLLGGRIVRSGGKELAAQLEQQGYDWLKSDLGRKETNLETEPPAKGASAVVTGEQAKGDSAVMTGEQAKDTSAVVTGEQAKGDSAVMTGEQAKGASAVTRKSAPEAVASSDDSEAPQPDAPEGGTPS